MSRIILLNGNGSAGKSSIAKALQKITAEPFLHVPMDAFIDMMPASMFETPDGLVFRKLEEDGKPVVEITTGPAAARVFYGMRFAMAALARKGNNLIIDDVLVAPSDAAEYAEAFDGLTVHRVGVFAPLKVLEERERARGDRELGLSRWLARHVHKGIQYDLELDTTRSSPEECAAEIKRVFGL